MNTYRIIQEALNNALKHAEANILSVNVTVKNEMLVIQIQDNGKGFNASNNSDGNGLNNMKKRAERIGGEITIDSEVSKGTKIILTKKLNT